MYPGDGSEQTVSGLTAFNTGSKTVDVGSSNVANGSSSSYVAWAWYAGATTDPSNQAGSITSQVRANVSAGFSVVTYTGNNTANATFGHGLGVTPEFVIIKKRSSTGNWIVYHKGMTSAAYYMYLNATDAQTNQGGAVNTWGVSSTLITLKELFGDYNASGATYVAYCFAPVVGYSSFGSYTGNGSASGDGPFVFCNFRPRFILTKRTDSTNNWTIVDAARNSYNVSNTALFPNLSAAESTNAEYAFDILSNGFKVRGTPGDSVNVSGGTYIYIAFAESPFAYARAR